MTASVRLLIADRLHRMNRGMLLFFAAFAGGMWWGMPFVGEPSRAVAASMAIAFQFGPLLTLQMIPRALWYLPASRRDVWRSGWLLSTLGVTALTTTAKLVAWLVPWGPGAPGLASIALSGLFDLASAGIGCALVAVSLYPRPARRALHLPWTIARQISSASLPLIGMLLFYLPAWSRLSLPIRWPELTAGSATALAAALALTMATWFYVPTPATPANRLAPARSAPIRPRPVRVSRLTGVPCLLAREAGWTFAIGGALTFAGVVVVLVISRVAHSQSDLMDLLQSAARVADGGAMRADDFGLVAFNLLVWYGLFAAAMAARFSLILRHLRALPIGAARLNALLVGWPALIWVLAWMAGTVLHYALLGHAPARPHLASVVALIGVCALVQAMTLRVSIVTRLMVFCSAAGLLPFVGLFTPPGPLVLGVLGAASLAAAIAVNHVALSRHSTYRPAVLPVIVAVPR
jgi:hypothetical protein